MPRYTYKATNGDGLLFQGIVDSTGRRRAAERVVRKHYKGLPKKRYLWKLHLMGESVVRIEWKHTDGKLVFVDTQLVPP